jgi:tetratricopeptide (TPR) repeat protein
MGYSFLFEGRYREAVAELEKGVEWNKKFSGTRYPIERLLEWGKMLALTGDIRGALRAFDEAKKLSVTTYDPAYNPVLIVADSLIGKALLTEGDVIRVRSIAETMAEQIEACVRREPYDAFFWDFHHLLMAELYLDEGHAQEARSALDSVSHLMRSPRYTILDARVRGRRGDTAAAIATYKSYCQNAYSLYSSVLGGDPFDYFLGCSLANYNLGKLYEETGDKAQSIEYYEETLEQWKNADEDLPELIDTKSRLANLKTATN